MKSNLMLVFDKHAKPKFHRKRKSLSRVDSRQTCIRYKARRRNLFLATVMEGKCSWDCKNPVLLSYQTRPSPLQDEALFPNGAHGSTKTSLVLTWRMKNAALFLDTHGSLWYSPLSSSSSGGGEGVVGGLSCTGRLPVSTLILTPSCPCLGVEV